MNAGPILCKIKEAAGFIARSQAAGQHALSERSVRLEGAEGCFLHVDYDQATAGIILAFVGNGRYELVERDTLAGRETPPWAPNNDVKCHARLLAYFASFVLPEQSDHPSLLETMLFLSKGYIPRRVTCVGHSLGGALATLAACWAGCTLATADVRCITFGAPRVGNASFATAFQNTTGVSYRIVNAADPKPHQPKPLFYSHVGHAVWLTGGELKYQDAPKQTKRPDDHGLAKYIAAVEALTGRIEGANLGGAEPVGKQHDLNVGEHALEAAGVAKDAVKGAIASMLPQRGSIKTEGLRGRCVDDFELGTGRGGSVAQTVLAGKVAQAMLLAWRAYDSEADFRKTTGLEHARMVEYKPDDTQAYVAWLDGGTAIFAFRGTESGKDAQTDADARSRPIPWMEDLFPKTRGHAGFMRQFESVTDPDHPERHIGLVLEGLSGRAAPTRVLCCGHSLGGALATLGAAWASYEYPSADVRCITLGSPRVGNFYFSAAVKYLVGNVHRLVHGWDPVPTVPPPGIGFKHVKGRMFLHNNTCKLKKRPWYMSYGLLIGRACDHFLEPYAEHVSHITGMEIIAEKLGLVRMDAAGELEAAEAAQNDHDGDGVPSSAQMPPRPPHAAAGAPAGAPGARPAAVKEEEGEVAGSAVPDDGKVDTVQEAMAAAAHDAKDALAGPAA